MATPDTINGHPVVAFVAGQGDPTRGVVVVRRETSAYNDYVCWRVWQDAIHPYTWRAESGIYDLDYEQALVILARRIGVHAVQ